VIRAGRTPALLASAILGFMAVTALGLPATSASPTASAAPAASRSAAANAAPAGVPPPPSGWTTQFSDDFTGSAGSAPSSSWQYDTGTNWGTGEIEDMTNSTANGDLDGNGDLDLTALGSGQSWTSARIQTTSANVGAPAGGELEVTASIEQPNPASGVGYWPAFWMLGDGQWPENGEIDILEDVNNLSEVSGTAHCGTDPGGPCNEPDGIGSGLVGCGGCQTGYHTYTMILNRTSPSNESITFYLDGNQYFSVSESQVGASAWQAAYDHNLSIIFDLAIGGAYPDGVCQCTAPTGATSSGGTMSVAYVAAYTTTTGGSATPAPAPAPAPAPTPATGTTTTTGGSGSGWGGTGGMTGNGGWTAAAWMTDGWSGGAWSGGAQPPPGWHGQTGRGTPPATATGQLTTYGGTCLDVRGADPAQFTPVQVYTCNGTSAQQWTVNRAGSTVHALGHCLDVNGGGTADGTPVDLYPCNGMGSQAFVPEPDGELYNPQSGKCLDDPNWSTAPGTQLQLWDCNGGGNQQWDLP
jgi:Ricin-type beta-trefoil lectin domain/Glycosyl hydrolases family 16